MNDGRIKVVKRGEKLTYEGTCRKCGSDLECHAKDVKGGDELGSRPRVTCPVCNGLVQVYVKRDHPLSRQ